MSIVAESSGGRSVPSTTRPFISAIGFNVSSLLAVPNAAAHSRAVAGGFAWVKVYFYNDSRKS